MSEMMKHGIQYRLAKEEDLFDVFDLVQYQDWNYNIEDIQGLFKQDPECFFVAIEPKGETLNDKLLGYCSGHRGLDGNGFIQQLIVNPNYRCHGIGGVLLRLCMDSMEGTNINVYSVLQSVPYYERIRFKTQDPAVIIRINQFIPKKPAGHVSENEVRMLSLDDTTDFNLLHKYDMSIVQQDRLEFLMVEKDSNDLCLASFSSTNEINGYMFCAKRHLGVKIKPLYAETLSAAKDLIVFLLDLLTPGEKIQVNLPLNNKEATALFMEFGLKESGDNPDDMRVLLWSETPPSVGYEKVYSTTNTMNQLL